MVFNEPKLLKLKSASGSALTVKDFSALQRAEIAEINMLLTALRLRIDFSALQRAEIAEIESENV